MRKTAESAEQRQTSEGAEAPVFRRHGWTGCWKNPKVRSFWRMRRRRRICKLLIHMTSRFFATLRMTAIDFFSGLW